VSANRALRFAARTLLAGAALIATILAVVCFFARKNIVSSRIYKYVGREYGDVFPCKTVYTVGHQQLNCRSRGVDITFSLNDLENVVEDDKYIEVSFGNRGLCLVPMRAFDSGTHKSAFLSAIQGI